MEKIIFYCTKKGRNEKYVCYGRPDAVKLVKSGKLDKFRNVIVEKDGEAFNLCSERARQYFGIRI